MTKPASAIDFLVTMYNLGKRLSDTERQLKEGGGGICKLLQTGLGKLPSLESQRGRHARCPGGSTSQPPTAAREHMLSGGGYANIAYVFEVCTPQTR